MSTEALLLAAAVSLAQTADPMVIDRAIGERLLPEVTTRLLSEIPATVAWGGHLAQRFGLAEAVPQLRAALAKWRGDAVDPDDAATWVRVQLLDALLQLRATVPAAEIAPHLHGRTFTPAFLLLAREPLANHAALGEVFALYDDSEDVEEAWIAAGNLLVEIAADWKGRAATRAVRASGLAARLLQRLRCTLDVVVLSPGQEAAQLGHGGRVRQAGLWLTQPDGFPPVPDHALLTFARPGLLLVAPGHVDVYACRTVKTGPFVSDASPWNGDASVLRWHWLCALASGFDGLSVSAERTVRYESPAQLAAAVADERAAYEARHREAVRGLVASKLLTDAEVGAARLLLEVRITDARADRRVPLPALPGTTRHPDR